MRPLRGLSFYGAHPLMGWNDLLDRAIRLKIQFVDANLAIVARRIAPQHSIGEIKTMINNIPVICAWDL